MFPQVLCRYSYPESREVSFSFFRKAKFDFFEEVDSDESVTVTERNTAQLHRDT